MEEEIRIFICSEVQAEEGIASRRLHWVPDAQEMISLYRQHPARMKTFFNGTMQDLRGFTVRRADIQDIINSNPSIDEFMIIFGVSHSAMIGVRNGTINPNEYDKQEFTTIIVGVQNDTVDKSYAVDYCEPCPPKCNAL